MLQSETRLRLVQMLRLWRDASRQRVGTSCMVTSVVTVGGRNLQLGRWPCFLTCHRGGGAGGEYRSVSRLGLLIGNRWMSRLGCPGMS